MEREKLNVFESEAKDGHAYALNALRDAAQKGNIDARYALARVYDNGSFRDYRLALVIPEDYVLNQITKDAEQGNVEAQIILAHFCFFGKGVPKSNSEGLNWYRKAAEQGSIYAQYQLGRRLEGDGNGSIEGDEEAAEWFRKAAKQGDIESQKRLGLMLIWAYRERGVRRDYIEGAMWLKKALEQGDLVVMGFLGDLYAAGKGVTQDYAVAHAYYNLAATLFEDRGKDRDKLATKMTPNQIEKAQDMAREKAAELERIMENSREKS